MRELILTAGLPRSGKTTWARKQGHPIVNPDSIRLALHGQRFFGPAEPMVWAIAYAMVEALFLAGHEAVIVDATNVAEKRRAPWRDLADRLEAKVTLHVITTSPDTCLTRARDEGDAEIMPVIERMAREWDLPRADSWRGPVSGLQCTK